MQCGQRTKICGRRSKLMTGWRRTVCVALRAMETPGGWCRRGQKKCTAQLCHFLLCCCCCCCFCWCACIRVQFSAQRHELQSGLKKQLFLRASISPGLQARFGGFPGPGFLKERRGGSQSTGRVPFFIRFCSVDGLLERKRKT